MQQTQNWRQGGAGWRAAALCAMMGTAALLGAGSAARAAAVPAIGATVASDGGQAVARYDKWELTFRVATGALNLCLPYDPSVPTYAANLRADEDARNGVSVDCLLLPPGQSDWTNAVVQPGFLYRPYVRTAPPANGNPHPNIENLVASGPDVWKVRFAPTQVGAWQYKVRVTDGGGTVTGVAGTFVCTPSAGSGFVRVAPADSRYLALDSGVCANLIGHNLFVNGYDAYKTSVDSISAGGASTLMRMWIAARSGQEIIGGFANSNGGRGWYLGGGGSEPASALVTDDAHSGRYAVRTPAGGELTDTLVPLKPNQSYTVSAWVKPQSAGITGIKLTTEDSAGYGSHRETVVPLGAGKDWVRVQTAIAAHDPQGGSNYVGTIKLWPQGAGALLIDDVQVMDNSTGADAVEIGDFERHVQYNQRQSWLLDFFAEYARAHGQYLRLNALENDDSVFDDVDLNGANAPHDDANFYGKTNDPNADIPVRRWQRYYARYLVARWGYATSVAEWEFCNEGPLFNGNHYAAAQSFAQAIHSWGAEGHRLASTSFWQNSSGTSYPADFYQSALYPDIDYADIHFYPSPGAQNSSYIPYGAPSNGFVRLPSGGPNELGALHIDAAGSAGKAQTQPLPVSRVWGRGVWTISYQIRTSADAQLKWFGRGPDLELWGKDLGLSAYTVPHSPVSPMLPPGYDWRTVSAQFTVPDDAPHDIGLSVFAKNLLHGSVDFADIKVLAPDGRLWAWYPFNEPTMEHDTVSLAQYLGLAYTSLSGDPCIGKPFSVGESDLVNPDGSYNKDIRQDSVGAWMRQFVWGHLNPSGALIFLYTNGGEEATAKGWWRYAGAYQKFLAGVPLANGHYRNIEAKSSNPNIIIVGQSDKQAARAHFFVYNRSGNWYNLTNSPAVIAPASGTITVPGLPDGSYRVQTWDTGTGQVQSETTIASKSGALPVPVIGLVGDTAFQVAPLTVPALAVSLRTDKAAAHPGDLVTYTLDYVNSSASDALHVMLPWTVPAGTTFVAASSGGTYNAARDAVIWNLGTVAAGQRGTVTLTVRVGS